MASKYSIEAVFKLIDNITAPLERVGVKGKTVGKALKRDFISAQQSVDRFGDSLRMAEKIAIGAGFVALGAGIAIATKQFIEFDAAATAATAKFKDLDVTSASYGDSLKKIGQAARDVAAVTEYNAVDTAGALDKMAMAGLTSEQSMKMLMGTTNLATAAGMDLTTAVDIATDSLGAFGLIAEDASQLQVNMDRVSDVMAKTTNMFNTDMPGMFEAIKKGGPAFTAAGQSVEDFSALIGVMASSGVKGSEAGTQLRNMMLSLANPSDKAAKAMAELGITAKDQNGNFLNIIDIIGQFEQGTKDMGTAEKAAALATIFGSRTVTGMNILLQEGSESLRGYTAQLENAGGAAANIAEAMRGSIKNKIEVLKSALTELGFKFVESFQEKGVGLITNLTESVSKFDPQPIISALTTTAQIIMKVMGLVWKFRSFIIGIAIAWGVYKTAMLAAVVIGPLLGMIKAVQVLMAAQKGMNVVQAIFNVLLNANPIGLIITGIGILIGLVILTVTHWKEICTVLGIAWEWIKKVASVIWDGLCNAFWSLMEIINENQNKVLGFIAVFTGPFGFILSMVNELRNNWDLVTETFQSDGIIAGLKRLAGVLLSGILAPIQGLLEVLAKIPGIGAKIAPAVEKIEEFRNTLKGTEETIEKPLLTRPAPAVNAAAPAAGSTVPPQASQAAPQMTRPAPGVTFPAGPVEAAPGADTAAPGGVHQPTLLDLRTSTATQGAAPAPARAASPWMVPVTASSAAIPAVTAQSSTPQAVSAAPAVNQAAPPAVAAPAPRTVQSTPRPVTVPVKWEFPEMIIPPEIIKTIMVPIEWAFPGSANQSPAAINRISPQVRPISQSVGQGITPPAPPMTQAEQMIYSRTESFETVRIEVSPEEGASAKVTKPPKSPNIELIVSGDV